MKTLRSVFAFAFVLALALGGRALAGGYGDSYLPYGDGVGAGGAKVRTLTASYTATAADAGTTFVCDSTAVSAVVVTIPAGLPLGTEFGLWQNSTTVNCVMQLSGTERLRVAGSATTAGGNVTYVGASAATTGFYLGVRRVVANGAIATDYGGTSYTGNTPTFN